ncbi:unnamed protein product [Trichobilharzia regenti]|nr:unnamed protein product [Trichobilharzia regenti]
MNLENAGLQDRVIDLEKRSAEQANELACLRSSLADCLRRINLLENARGMKLYSSSLHRPILHNYAFGLNSDPQGGGAVSVAAFQNKSTFSRLLGAHH